MRVGWIAEGFTLGKFAVSHGVVVTRGYEAYHGMLGLRCLYHYAATVVASARASRHLHHKLEGALRSPKVGHGQQIICIEDADGKVSYFFSFNDIGAVTVLGRNKLNIYRGEDIFQIKGGKRFNALKYVQIYHRYKNIRKGEPYAEFLGL